MCILYQFFSDFYTEWWIYSKFIEVVVTIVNLCHGFFLVLVEGPPAPPPHDCTTVVDLPLYEGHELLSRL